MEVQRGRSKSSCGSNYSKSPPPKSQCEPTHTIYVSCLPSDIAEENLKQIFQVYGQIKKVIFKVKQNGFAYALIEFTDQQMAFEALKKLNGAKIGDKIIQIKFKTTKITNSGQSGSENKAMRSSYGMNNQYNKSRNGSQDSRDFNGRGRGRGRGGDRGRGGRGRGGFHQQSETRVRFSGYQSNYKDQKNQYKYGNHKYQHKIEQKNGQLGYFRGQTSQRGRGSRGRGGRGQGNLRNFNNRNQRNSQNNDHGHYSDKKGRVEQVERKMQNSEPTQEPESY